MKEKNSSSIHTTNSNNKQI